MKSNQLLTKTNHLVPALMVPARAGDVLRTTLASLLAAAHYSAAASQIQRAVGTIPATELAGLALETGNQCRSGHAPNAALSCYLTARRCAPKKEDAFMRLAELCLERAESKPLGLAVYRHLGILRGVGPAPVRPSHLFQDPDNLVPDDRRLHALLPISPSSVETTPSPLAPSKPILAPKSN
jgi:hypothetical protein